MWTERSKCTRTVFIITVVFSLSIYSDRYCVLNYKIYLFKFSVLQTESIGYYVKVLEVRNIFLLAVTNKAVTDFSLLHDNVTLIYNHLIMGIFVVQFHARPVHSCTQLFGLGDCEDNFWNLLKKWWQIRYVELMEITGRIHFHSIYTSFCWFMIFDTQTSKKLEERCSWTLFDSYSATYNLSYFLFLLNGFLDGHLHQLIRAAGITWPHQPCI